MADLNGPGSSRMALVPLVLGCIAVVCIAFSWPLERGWGRSSRSHVAAVLSRQQDAWNGGDLEGFMTGYWESGELTFFSGGKVEKGYAALLTR